MEGHIVTIEIQSKTNSALGHTASFYTHETDVQRVKYLYHKLTHENYGDVVGADGSHTLHLNGEYPQVQRLASVEAVDAEELESHKNDGLLPLDFI